jgi:hypothetical protein
VGAELNQQKSAVLVNAIYMAFLAYESARKTIVEMTDPSRSDGDQPRQRALCLRISHEMV